MFGCSADPRLMGASTQNCVAGKHRGAFVRVSLRLESRWRKALEKQYLFAVRFQLVFFFFLKQETVRHSRYKIFT